MLYLERHVSENRPDPGDNVRAALLVVIGVVMLGPGALAILFIAGGAKGGGWLPPCSFRWWACSSS
jgi:hypothetical protein